MFNARLLSLLVAALQVFGIDAFTLTMTPDHVRINKDLQSVSFTCVSDSALVGCQFSWWNYWGETEGPLVDLSRGPRSQTNRAYRTSYVGRGLGSGDCGVSLEVSGWKSWIVACRVRGETGGWRYAWADLVADNTHDPLSHTMTTPREMVVLPGGEIRFTVKANEPLDYCVFTLPHMLLKPDRLDFEQGAASPNSTGRHRYLGAGLRSGECGLKLTDIREADNGLLSADAVVTAQGWFTVTTGKMDRRFMALTVARSPTEPTLSVTYTGTNLTATCRAEDSRPVANLTWILGDRVIREDENDDTLANPNDTWRWPWMEGSIQQTITLQLKPEDQGKTLKCVVSHVSLDQPYEAKKLISFTATPVWTPNLCPPLISQSVLISCSLAGEAVDCNQPQQFATEAQLACKPGFSLPSGFVHFRKVVCQRSGNWNHKVFTCFSDCGRRISNDVIPLVANGTDVKKGEFPWHVGIFKDVSGNGNIQQWCGGSLITPQVVVSAAHCFWRSSKRNPDVSDFKVAAGKLLLAWDDPDPGVQKRNISEIVVHELFRGQSGGFGSDIAIVRLDSQLEVNPRVNLVCVDWDSTLESRQLRTGSVGVVAGWGYTQDGVQPDSLKYVELPFVPSQTCINSLPPHQQSLVTTEKICAGFLNRSTSVCRGDSGGGLVFLQPGTNQYYLRGIVSSNFAPFDNTDICYSQHYTAFTKLSSYITWIQGHNITHASE